MRFTSEELAIKIEGTILLDALRHSPIGLRYIDPDRNERNFNKVFEYLRGTKQEEDAEYIVPLISGHTR